MNFPNENYTTKIKIAKKPLTVGIFIEKNK